MRPLLGQDCICPEGLGRVVEIQVNQYGDITGIRVDTLVKNRGRMWSPDNVKLFRLSPTEDVSNA